MVENEYKIALTTKAQKHLNIVTLSKYNKKVLEIFLDLKKDPHSTSKIPLVGYAPKRYKIKINDQHRITFSIFEKEKVVKVYSVWGHYDD